MQSNRGQHEPECPLAHDIMNRLSVIVGNCELLVEKTSADSPLLERILLIRDQAHAIVRELAQFQCDLIRLRTIDNQKKTAGA